MKSNNKGFNLVELMIVISLIGLLAAIAIPNYVKKRELAKQVVKAEEAVIAQMHTTNAMTNVVAAANVPEPISFGHNIYYFKEVGLEFPKAVNAFIDLHSNTLEVVTFTTDVSVCNRVGSNNIYFNCGTSVGQTVAFREKK